MQHSAAPSSGPTSIFRKLFALSAPIVGLNILNVLSLAVDTAMCGRLPNAKVALTALGFASQVMFLLIVAMIGLTIGTVALVARAYGAGETERVNHITTQSFMCTVLLSVGVAIFGNMLAGPIISALGASKEVTQTALMYLRPMLVGAIFTYLSVLFAAILRGVGNTRLAFFIALLSNALNVFLNYCLILGNLGFPALGLQGAAFGTIFSQAIGLALMIFLLRRGAIHNFTLSLRPRPFDRPLVKTFIGIGTPASLDMLILNASLLSLIGMLGWINELTVAAHGIGLRIQALAFVPGLGISQATGAMVGQALGAKNPDQARAVVRSSVWLCLGVMMGIGLVIILAAHPIIGLFEVRPDSPLGQYSLTWIYLLGLGMPPVGIYIAYIGMLQGSGATKSSLRINFISTLFFQIPLSWFLGFPMGLGAVGVWLGFPLSFFVKAVYGYIIYKREDWLQVGSRI